MKTSRSERRIPRLKGIYWLLFSQATCSRVGLAVRAIREISKSPVAIYTIKTNCTVINHCTKVVGHFLGDCPHLCPNPTLTCIQVYKRCHKCARADEKRKNCTYELLWIGAHSRLRFCEVVSILELRMPYRAQAGLEPNRGFGAPGILFLELSLNAV